MKSYVVYRKDHRWTERVWDCVQELSGSWFLNPSNLALIDPRYVFFLHWSQKVPASITLRYEAVNMHCTPLPVGRGSHPVQNMKLRGFTETVMTAHRMTDEIDAGPIYDIDGPISLAGSYEDVLARFVDPVVRLITMIVRDEPEPQPQVGEVVKFSRLSAEELARANAL